MDMESFLHVSSLPVNPDRLEVYRQAQKADPICSQIIAYCNQGWPSRHRIEEKYRSYWKVRSELSIVDNLLLFGTRIVVPKNLQAETLSKIHYGHQGIHRCRQRVSSAVWWPGVAKQVETFVKSCPQCLKTTPPPTQPLLQIPLPSHPWERVAADLFELKKTTYLLVVDYYSRFVEVQKLTSTTSTNVIAALKSIFSLHGIPLTFMSDNGPQFVPRK